jgi:hypothetical protein
MGISAHGRHADLENMMLLSLVLDRAGPEPDRAAARAIEFGPMYEHRANPVNHSLKRNLAYGSSRRRIGMTAPLQSSILRA